MEKSEIRRKIKNLRMMLSEMEKASAADEVFAQLEKTAAFMMAENILMYHSLPDELSTIKFLKKWHDRKRFFLPRVNGVNLDILPYEETRLELGSFHIEEPTGEDVVDVDDIELMVIPAVAFDRKGNRLGRGKGFYDRLLSTSKATKIGVGYEFQLFDSLPSEPHDVAMDMVITQKTVIKL
ncbi:MAG: 5-formyltetrahydrofolate cyclo-ligase [Muribaculaceae bacterium]|nr:5-formyltetrahydrofolate cyclo-ligase [Muribaculaceae bacterium]MDE6553722.1 5-formyltetrahydrofolate cyclo-ligase [Muribaculaceae bacterium]MDE7351255.1 5-formyltetrahydrofolate cyclo-ligase [Muribaculaceae bacterium]